MAARPPYTSAASDEISDAASAASGSASGSDQKPQGIEDGEEEVPDDHSQEKGSDEESSDSTEGEVGDARLGTPNDSQAPLGAMLAVARPSGEQVHGAAGLAPPAQQHPCYGDPQVGFAVAQHQFGDAHAPTYSEPLPALRLRVVVARGVTSRPLPCLDADGLNFVIGRGVQPPAFWNQLVPEDLQTRIWREHFAIVCRRIRNRRLLFLQANGELVINGRAVSSQTCRIQDGDCICFVDDHREAFLIMALEVPSMPRCISTPDWELRRRREQGACAECGEECVLL